jgi:hypothetical protein
MKNAWMRQRAVYSTLLRREAWEYRDWWTIILATCVAMSAFLLIAAHYQYPHADEAISVSQSFLLLRWCQGFFMCGCAIMAMAHAAHGIFDERQDRTIGFWQAWPVPERTRIFAKSIVVSWGWPLLGCIGTLCSWGLAGLMHLMLGEGREFIVQSRSFIMDLGLLYLWMGAWAWPLACIWLWCSALAPRSPWLWCWVIGAVLAALGLWIQGPALQMGLNMILGPAYGTLVQALGLDASWFPWEIGSIAWWLSCVVGWIAVQHASWHLTHNPE